MNSRSVTVENLLRVFPEVLSRSTKIQALGEVVAKYLAQVVEDTKNCSIYANVDTLPEAVLDILAYDFKVDWWDYELSVEEKQRVLRQSFTVHKHLGTKGAVERAVSAIYENTQVVEWWEYGGEPYHFRLRIDIAYANVNPSKHSRVLKKVEYYKNQRSILDGVEYYNVGASAGIYTFASNIAGGLQESAAATRY